MGFITSEALAETGYVVLDDHTSAADPAEWLDLEYVGWRSSGITRFAPLTSYAGDVDCNGFWNHTPPRPTKTASGSSRRSRSPPRSSAGHRSRAPASAAAA